MPGAEFVKAQLIWPLVVFYLTSLVARGIVPMDRRDQRAMCFLSAVSF